VGLLWSFCGGSRYSLILIANVILFGATDFKTRIVALIGTFLFLCYIRVFNSASGWDLILFPLLWFVFFVACGWFGHFKTMLFRRAVPGGRGAGPQRSPLFRPHSFVFIRAILTAAQSLVASAIIGFIPIFWAYPNRLLLIRGAESVLKCVRKHYRSSIVDRWYLRFNAFGLRGKAVFSLKYFGPFLHKTVSWRR